MPIIGFKQAFLSVNLSINHILRLSAKQHQRHEQIPEILSSHVVGLSYDADEEHKHKRPEGFSDSIKDQTAEIHVLPIKERHYFKEQVSCIRYEVPTVAPIIAPMNCASNSFLRYLFFLKK